jgi:hypothetical protein
MHLIMRLVVIRTTSMQQVLCRPVHATVIDGSAGTALKLAMQLGPN